MPWQINWIVKGTRQASFKWSTDPQDWTHHLILSVHCIGKRNNFFYVNVVKKSTYTDICTYILQFPNQSQYSSILKKLIQNGEVLNSFIIILFFYNGRAMDVKYIIWSNYILLLNIYSFFVTVLEVWIVAQLLVVSLQVPDMKVSEVNVSQCGKALLPSNYCTICSLNPWRTSCLKKGLKSCWSWIPPYLWFRGRCSKVLATLKSLAKGM